MTQADARSGSFLQRAEHVSGGASTRVNTQVVRPSRLGKCETLGARQNSNLRTPARYAQRTAMYVCLYSSLRPRSEGLPLVSGRSCHSRR